MSGETIDLYEELHRVVRGLDEAGVAYALAGGLTVSLHARARSTDDIDLLIAESDLDAATAAIRPSGDEARMGPFTVAKGRLRIVTRDDLRALRRLRGSPQDLADLAALDAGESEPS